MKEKYNEKLVEAFQKMSDEQKAEFYKPASVPSYEEIHQRLKEVFCPYAPTPEKEIVEGWVMRDDNNEIALFLQKPTCDEDGYWDLTGDYYNFDKKLFPQITPSSKPCKAKIEITLIDEKGE